MAKVCQLTGKKAQSGNKRSHALNATKRKWNVNLQKTTTRELHNRIYIACYVEYAICLH